MRTLSTSTLIEGRKGAFYKAMARNNSYSRLRCRFDEAIIVRIYSKFQVKVVKNQRFQNLRATVDGTHDDHSIEDAGAENYLQREWVNFPEESRAIFETNCCCDKHSKELIL